jgi:hypothetical protein
MKKLLLALALLSLPAYAQLVITVPNAGTTGTTIGSLAKLTGAPSTAVITATTDTSGIVGIVIGWTGSSATTGSAVIARGGEASCTFDGATTAGDYVQNSTTTSGDCHDTGSATVPTSGQILGRVLSTNASSGLYAMTVETGPLGVPGTAAQIGAAFNLAQYDVLYSGGTSAAPLGAAISGIQEDSTSAAPIAATGHNIAVPLTCADSSGSGTAQVCNTSPTFTPVAGDYIIYTTTTANTGTGLTINVNSLGTKSVAKWQTATTLAANDVRANTEILMKYDGTNWEMDSIGNAPSGGSGYSTIDYNGTGLTQRSTLNFNPPFTAVDNSSATRTDVSYNPQTTIWLNEEFLGGPTSCANASTDNVGPFVCNGAGNTVTYADATGSYKGGWNCAIAASTSDSCTLTTRRSLVNPASTTFDLKFGVAIGAVTDVQLYAGLIQIGNGRHAGIRFDTSQSDTAVMCISNNGSADQAVTTGFTPTAATTFDVHIIGTGSAITCSINGGTAVSPTTTSSALNAGFAGMDIVTAAQANTLQMTYYHMVVYGLSQ